MTERQRLILFVVLCVAVMAYIVAAALNVAPR